MNDNTGLALASNEEVVTTGRFKLGNIRVWLHWRATLTTNRLVIDTPKTFLLVIPLGSIRFSQPLTNLTDVTFQTGYGRLAAILGVVALLFGLVALGMPNSQGLGLVFTIYGVVSLLNVIQPYVSVMNNRGAGVFRRAAI